MSTVNGFQVGSETLKYNYESLDNYNTPNFSTSSSTTYAVGDYVMYNGKLYKCTTATTGGTWVSGSWNEAVLSDDVSDLTLQLSDVESALTNTNTLVDNLQNAIFETITHSFTNTVDVTSGSYSQSTKVLDAIIPSGTEYSFILTTTATKSGNIALYEQHPDGTYTALSYNYTPGTELTLTTAKDTTHFNIVVGSGFTSAGELTATAEYTVTNPDAINKQINELEDSVDDLDSSISGKVDKSAMAFCTLATIPASANRLDETKLITGKIINYYSGAITDSNLQMIYYLPVSPSDVIYCWRYHNNGVISGTFNGIATFDSSNSFVRSGAGGDQHTFTVPSGIYKVAMNLSYTQYSSGDKFMLILNDSTQPSEYEDYNDAYNAYEAKNVFQRSVDFNSILPMSCKLPESGYIESYGHAGLSAYYPLNTAPAIIGAKKAGLGGVEMDVQITSDGKYVLYHDETLERVGGTATQTIASMTLAQLEEFDFGAWFSNKFIGTPICTLDEAAQLCRELGLKMYIDCKKVKTVQEITDAATILETWGMLDSAVWIVGTFVNIWTALPNAKVMFATGGKLTGSSWADPETGWFAGFNSNFPEDKKQFVDGMPVVPEGVWFGVTQNYTIKDSDGYGIEGLNREAELARERNIKYGFYAVDDIETIADLSAGVPYQQYLASNSISYQNAMNAHYGINLADYML